MGLEREQESVEMQERMAICSKAFRSYWRWKDVLDAVVIHCGDFSMREEDL